MMKIYEDVQKITDEGGLTVVFGKFDGVHKGHQKLMRTARRIADESGEQLAVMIIDMAQGMICDEPTQLGKLAALGVDIVIKLRFEDIKDISAEAFLRSILLEKLGAGNIVAGPDVRFGQGAQGDAAYLAEHCDWGYKLYIIDKETYLGEDISSSRIRTAIQDGRRAEADDML